MIDKQKQGASNREWGAFAENKAAEYLRSNGYIIREQNLLLGHIEIDIVAQKNNEIIFIEVKARNGENEDPAEAVDTKKRNKMIAGANIYLSHLKYDYYWRFDIITLTGTPKSYIIDHFPDAFYPPCRTRGSKRR